MIFNEFGSKENPVVICMHGMCQDWHSMHEFLSKLEDRYYVVYPAMTGFSEGSEDFVDFSDECRQMEEYVNKNFGGKILGFYGISQGTLLGSELLARNNIIVEHAYFDGTYVAHQGKLAGWMSYKIFSSAKKKGGKFPKIMDIEMKLMGLDKVGYDMLRYTYWDVSFQSMKENMMKNYTYHVKPEIANTKTKITLCCGSKEPFAKKSHKMLKKYITPVNEMILEGIGHGEQLYTKPDEVCNQIVKAFEGC